MKKTLAKQHVDENETADFLGTPVATLRDWRFRKTGPAYCKFGRSVRYNVDDLIRFAQQARVHTSGCTV